MDRCVCISSYSDYHDNLSIILSLSSNYSSDHTRYTLWFGLWIAVTNIQKKFNDVVPL
jgi:hypothetical protein